MNNNPNDERRSFYFVIMTIILIIAGWLGILFQNELLLTISNAYTKVIFAVMTLIFSIKELANNKHNKRALFAKWFSISYLILQGLMILIFVFLFK